MKPTITLTTEKGTQTIDLTNIKELILQYTKSTGIIEMCYTQISSVETIIDLNTKVKEKNKKKRTPATFKKGFRKDSQAIQRITKDQLNKILIEYEQASKSNKGTAVLKRWAKKLGLKTNTLSAWISRIKQLKKGQPTHGTSKALKEMYGNN